MVVITAVPTDDLLASLLNMKRAGRRVVLLHVGGREPVPVPDGLTVFHVRDDVMWHELEQLPLEENAV